MAGQPKLPLTANLGTGNLPYSEGWLCFPNTFSEYTWVTGSKDSGAKQCHYNILCNILLPGHQTEVQVILTPSCQLPLPRPNHFQFATARDYHSHNYLLVFLHVIALQWVISSGSALICSFFLLSCQGMNKFSYLTETSFHFCPSLDLIWAQSFLCDSEWWSLPVRHCTGDCQQPVCLWGCRSCHQTGVQPWEGRQNKNKQRDLPEQSCKC